MKVLNLSIDKKILEKDSAVAKRIVWFEEIVEKYIILVPFLEKKELKLSENVFAYGSGGKNKVRQFFSVWKTASEVLKKEKFDVITTQDPYFTGMLGLFLTKKYNIPLEVQVHGLGEVGFLKRILRKFILKRADGIRAVGLRLKKEIMAMGLSEEKIIVIPVYTGTDVQVNTPKTYPSGEFIFLFVGRLVPVKNIQMQIEAMKILKEQSVRVKLWIVGTGPEEKRLKKLVSQYGLEDVVEFFGWKNTKELEEFYKKAHCLLLTSKSEGWGMVVLEAGAYGMPVIMTDVGLVGEIITDDVNGKIVSCNNTMELVKIMEQIIKDKNLFEKLSRNILNTIREFPTRKEILQKYLSGWGKIV